jgi:two-component system sensor histidine kinase NblS
VLDLSRLESDRRYQFSALDIHQPIEQILRTYQLNAKDKEITLIQDIEPALPPVVGNYDLMLQVFGNLVGNGLKFSSAGGCVAIRAYRAPTTVEHPDFAGNVRIEIADTGIGIAPEDQDAIFDRFYRVENRVHTLEGTGLGLSIVKNIIDKHNSQMCLVSEVGIGTTFWFDLPVYDASTIEPRLTTSKDENHQQDAIASVTVQATPKESA